MKFCLLMSDVLARVDEQGALAVSALVHGDLYGLFNIRLALETFQFVLCFRHSHHLRYLSLALRPL